MITFIDTIEARGKVVVEFKGKYFMKYVTLARSKRCFFNYEEKFYELTAQQSLDMYDLATRLKNEQIVFPEGLLEKLERLKYGKYETIKYRKHKIDKSLLVLPPLKGKEGFENFQQDAIEKSLSQNCMGIFEPMGVGKSYIISVVIAHLFHWNRVDRLLFIVPTIALINTKKELLKFTNIFNENDIEILTAKNRDCFDRDPRVVITTLRSFQLVSDDAYKKKNKGNLKKYPKPQYDFSKWGNSRVIVIDESHTIKNPKARSVQVLMMNKKYFKFRYLMTGTPSPNRFIELYNQMKFIDASLVHQAYDDFLNSVCNLGKQFGKKYIAGFINYVYKDKAKEYEKRFSNYVIRHKQEELLDLPEMIIKKHLIELSGLQLEIYQELVITVLKKLKENKSGVLELKTVINKFPFIRLALDNPNVINLQDYENPKLEKLIKKFKFEKHHQKLQALKELVESLLEQNKKVTIFDFHPSILNSLSNIFKKHNPVVIHGQIDFPKGKDKADYRTELLDQFRFSKDRNLLLGSQKILSTAENLQQCSNVIYFSRDDSFVDWEQSKKRFHRNGQKETVIINVLIFEDSLDIRTDTLLKVKNKLNETIFVDGEMDKTKWQLLFKGKV